MCTDVWISVCMCVHLWMFSPLSPFSIAPMYMCIELTSQDCATYVGASSWSRFFISWQLLATCSSPPRAEAMWNLPHPHWHDSRYCHNCWSDSGRHILGVPECSFFWTLSWGRILISLLSVAHFGLTFSLIFIILPLPKCVFRPTAMYLFEYLGVDSTRALMLPYACLTQLPYSWQIQGTPAFCCSPYSSAAASVLYRLFLSRMAPVHLVHFIIKSLRLAFIWDRSLAVFVLCGVDMFKEYRLSPRDHFPPVHSVQGSMYVTVSSSGATAGSQCAYY